MGGLGRENWVQESSKLPTLSGSYIPWREEQQAALVQADGAEYHRLCPSASSFGYLHASLEKGKAEQPYNPLAFGDGTR